MLQEFSQRCQTDEIKSECFSNSLQSKIHSRKVIHFNLSLYSQGEIVFTHNRPKGADFQKFDPKKPVFTDMHLYNNVEIPGEEDGVSDYDIEPSQPDPVFPPNHGEEGTDSEFEGDLQSEYEETEPVASEDEDLFIDEPEEPTVLLYDMVKVCII